MNYSLRPYQKTIFENCIKSYERGINRQLAVAFTGAGKSFTCIQIGKHFVDKRKRVIILVDQDDLVWQWQNAFQKFTPEISVSIEKAEYKAKMTSDVVIASIQTLGRKGKKRIKRFKDQHFDLMIADECDRSIAPSWIRVMEYFGFGKDNFEDGNLLLGVTATPYRSSGESLGLLYDDIIANFDIGYGVSNGWLTDIDYYDIQTKTDISNVKKARGDYVLSQLSETVNTETRNAEILKAYLEYSKGQQAIVYCADVDHAYTLREVFVAHDISAEVIEANTDKTDRKQHVKDFDEQELDVILNYSTMSRGIDFPELRTIIFARPIGSKNLYTQILGRVLRPSQTAKVDTYDTAEARKMAIELSSKPLAKVIDLKDQTLKPNDAVHLPSLLGLHNDVTKKKKQQFFKEVVEPLDRLKKEKKVDVSQITDLDQIELITKKRNYEIKSLQLSPEVSKFTDRTWNETTNGYEISYSDENKVLIIESDSAHEELLDSKQWNLLEYDTKSKVTKELQTFNSLSGAFKVADEYADRNQWKSVFLNKNEKWRNDGVTEGQLRMLNKFFRYRNGYSEFETLSERYKDTNVPKLRWKENKFGIDKGTLLTKGLASKLIDSKFNGR